MKKLALAALAAASLATSPAPARALDAATLQSDLDALVADGDALVAAYRATLLTSTRMDDQLAALETRTVSWLADVQGVHAAIVASQGSTLALTTGILADLDRLALTGSVLAAELQRLSAQAVALSAVTWRSTLEVSLHTILRLSDDIGTMADRILEMANKILLMADQIGLMADRILATQTLQNTNVKLVVDAILVTQQNVIQVIALLFT